MMSLAFLFVFFQLLCSWPACITYVSPLFPLAEAEDTITSSNHLFLNLLFSPIALMGFLIFCQANSLAPVYLRYVNTLFLFWALTRPIVFSAIKHQRFFNIIFFISPRNILYHYILSSSFCYFSVCFMTPAKRRIRSFFPVLSKLCSRCMGDALTSAEQPT